MSYAIQFDASTVAPSVPFELLPNGWYNAVIVESEAKPTKKAGGEMLQLTMEVLDGPYQGSKIFDRLNLVNENPKAVELAYRTLSSICHASGRIQIQDVAELHGAPLMVKLRVSAPTEQYDAGNEVKGYKACDGSPSCSDPRPTAAPKTAAAPAQAPAAQQAWNAPVQAPPQAPVQQYAPPAQQAPVQMAPQAPAQQFSQPPQGWTPPGQAPVQAQAPQAPQAPQAGWTPPGAAQAAPPAGATPAWAQ